MTSGGAGLIPGQIINNVRTLFQAPFDQGSAVTLPENPPDVPQSVSISSGDYTSNTEPPVITNSPFGVNAVFIQTYAGNWAECAGTGECFYQSVAPITNFLNTPASGLLLGVLGPILSPVVQLGNSVNAIIGSLRNGDFIGAINTLINIPANVLNAFLNGVGVTDVTPIISRIVTLPDSIKELSVNLGGLLNAMPQNGSLNGTDDPPTQYGGGVGMDALGLTVSYPDPFAIGLPIGLIGSLIGTSQFVAGKMRVTPPNSANAVRAAATAAPATAAEAEAPEAPSATDARDTADAPAVGTSSGAADTPTAPARGKSRAKAAGNGDSAAPTRARRGAA